MSTSPYKLYIFYYQKEKDNDRSKKYGRQFSKAERNAGLSFVRRLYLLEFVSLRFGEPTFPVSRDTSRCRRIRSVLDRRSGRNWRWKGRGRLETSVWSIKRKKKRRIHKYHEEVTARTRTIDRSRDRSETDQIS